MKLLKKHTTSKGNELEFFTDFSHLNHDQMVVIDNSCQLQRTYTIGRKAILCFDDYDTGGQIVKSFKQVIDCWINEKIHF